MEKKIKRRQKAEKWRRKVNIREEKKQRKKQCLLRQKRRRLKSKILGHDVTTAESKGINPETVRKKELGKKCFKCQKFGHTAIQRYGTKK